MTTHLSIKDKSDNSRFQKASAEEVWEHEHAFPLQEGLIKGLFAKILQVAEPGKESRGAESDLFQGFKDLLGIGLFKQHAVAYYAGLLNTTPQNLIAVCRKAVNQSAADVLAESIIDEACNSCHRATKHAINVIKIPDSPPFTNQVYQPQQP